MCELTCFVSHKLLQPLSLLVTGTTEDLTSALAGAQSLVIAVGFVPGNPLKMNAAAHEVDNVGTCKLIVS